VTDHKFDVGRALGRCAKRVLVGSWPFETRVRNLQADTQGGQPRASLDQRKQAPRSIPSHRPKSCSCRWSGRWHSARGARDATSATRRGFRRTGWRSSLARSRTAASRVPWCAPCCQYTTCPTAPRRSEARSCTEEASLEMVAAKATREATVVATPDAGGLRCENARRM
jgi:hypothetical protein